MASIQFRLSSKSDKSTGLSEVLVRFFHGKAIDQRAKTNIFVRPDYWNQKSPHLLTREMVMEKLNIVPSTLWRWAKSGYLVPVNVGGQRRYKSTDVDEILEGKR